MGVGPPCNLFPRVYRVMTNKELHVRECDVLRGNCLGKCLLGAVFIKLRESSMGSHQLCIIMILFARKIMTTVFGSHLHPGCSR